MDESSVLGMILHVLFEVLIKGLGRWLVDIIWFDEDALVRKLKTTILSIEAMLNCTTQKQIANAAAREWLNELQDAVYDARILLDEVCAESSHGKLGSRARRKEVKRVLDKLEYMVGQKDILGLRELEISPLCKSPTTSFLQESHVYGRNDDMEAITRLLLSYDESSDITSVIAIAGDAGVGKTTLAQLVINDKRIQEQYDLKVWVCVSNGFDASSVSKAILEAVTMSSCDIRELSVLQIRLREEISGKRLLLVLDDVTDENCTEWEILKGPLRFCSRESKIIVTTCDENIAAMMRTLPAYHLSRLSFKDCWSIFARYALHGNRFVADPELKEVGRGIVKKCKGHPLAAKTIGNLLRHQPNREGWDAVLKDESWDSSHDIISIIQNLRLKSRRNLVERNREKYASTMRRRHSVATIRDKMIPLPPMYKAIRSKKAWLPTLLILWIIVWSFLSLAVFNVTNNHLRFERGKLHRRMCNRGVRSLENYIKAYLDDKYEHAIHMLQLFSYQNVSNEAVSKAVSSNPGLYLVRVTECEKGLLSPSRFQGHRPQGPFSLCPLQTISEQERAHFLKATALGNVKIFRDIFFPTGDFSVFVYPVHTSARSTSGSSSSQESMKSVVGYIAVLIPFKCLVESLLGFNHTDGSHSQAIWMNVHLRYNSSSFLAYGQHHLENDKPILYKSNLPHEQGWTSEIICGHHEEKLPLTRPITITTLFFICGVLLGCKIYSMANSILLTGEASSFIQELHAHTEAIDAATSRQLATAWQNITTPAHDIPDSLALLLNTHLSPSQESFAKFAHTCARNLITTIKEVLRRSN